MSRFDCFRCGELGHYAAGCPLLNPAASFSEHMDRVAFYVDRWVAGKMNLQEKRVSISLENQLWYGDLKCPRHLTYP